MKTVETQIGNTRIITHMPDDMEAAMERYAKRFSEILGVEVTVTGPIEPDEGVQ